MAPSSLDYSRWEHVGSDDDEEELGPTARPDHPDMLKPVQRTTEQQTWFVKTDAWTFEATKSDDMVWYWGLPPEAKASAKCMIGTSPERQFIEILKTKKLCSLTAEKTSRVVVVQLACPNMWRRLRLRENMTLDVAHRVFYAALTGLDAKKVAYFFTDLKDGAIWCPFDVEENRARSLFIDALEPYAATIGDILKSNEDHLGYVLNWNERHALRLEHVMDEDDPSVVSKGKVVVLDGGSNVGTREKIDLEECQEAIDRALMSSSSDQKETALPLVRCCANCATPCGQKGSNGLKACSRCRLVYYCSRDCQGADWKNGHNRSCAGVISKKNAKVFKNKMTDGLKKRDTKFREKQQREKDELLQGGGSSFAPPY